jgi:hypothetical protein
VRSGRDGEKNGKWRAGGSQPVRKAEGDGEKKKERG